MAADPTNRASAASGLRLAYADPPYPGMAHLYPEKQEVDHVALLARLQNYDGWALSTGEKQLQSILALCPEDVRVCAWCKPNAPPFFAHPYPSWEPVILKPARRLDKDNTRNYLVAPAPSGFIDKQTPFIGKKPEAFCEWVIRCLGATPSDTLDDLFPGTGVMGRVWARWQAQPSLWVKSTGGTKRKRERITRRTGTVSLEVAE